MHAILAVCNATDYISVCSNAFVKNIPKLKISSANLDTPIMLTLAVRPQRVNTFSTVGKSFGLKYCK